MSTAKMTKKSTDLEIVETSLREVDREVDALQRRIADLQRADAIAADAVEMQALEVEIRAACDAFDEAVKSRWASEWNKLEEILAESEQIRADLEEARELGSNARDTPLALISLAVPPMLGRQMPHYVGGALDGPAHLRQVLVRGQVGVDARWAHRNGLIS